MSIQLWGAMAFGAFIGWFVYYINRYRKGDVSFADLTTVLGTIGGAAVLVLFKAETDLFGAYGIGLFIGFFAYFLMMVVLVVSSPNFSADFFLDGRRKRPVEPWYIPDEIKSPERPAAFIPLAVEAGMLGLHPAAAQAFSAQMMRPAAAAPAFMAPPDPGEEKAKEVRATCVKEWPANKDDCNKFAKAVAKTFGVTLTGDANTILDAVQNDLNWTQHKEDGAAASDAARSGHLVIAGLKANPHGHVVVVVAPPGASNPKYPHAYWGSMTSGDIRENGGKGLTINWSFDKDDRDRVIYSSRPI